MTDAQRTLARFLDVNNHMLYWAEGKGREGKGTGWSFFRSLSEPRGSSAWLRQLQQQQERRLYPACDRMYAFYSSSIAVGAGDRRRSQAFRRPSQANFFAAGGPRAEREKRSEGGEV